MDNFSDANKLGQGGFGIVYSVTIRKIVSIDTEVVVSFISGRKFYKFSCVLNI